MCSVKIENASERENLADLRLDHPIYLIKSTLGKKQRLPKVASDSFECTKLVLFEACSLHCHEV